jgi:hypothetical protein
LRGLIIAAIENDENLDLLRQALQEVAKEIEVLLPKDK